MTMLPQHATWCTAGIFMIMVVHDLFLQSLVSYYVEHAQKLLAYTIWTPELFSCKFMDIYQWQSCCHLLSMYNSSRNLWDFSKCFACSLILFQSCQGFQGMHTSRFDKIPSSNAGIIVSEGPVIRWTQAEGLQRHFSLSGIKDAVTLLIIHSLGCGNIKLSMFLNKLIHNSYFLRVAAIFTVALVWLSTSVLCTSQHMASQ